MHLINHFWKHIFYVVYKHREIKIVYSILGPIIGLRKEKRNNNSIKKNNKEIHRIHRPSHSFSNFLYLHVPHVAL